MKYWGTITLNGVTSQRAITFKRNLCAIGDFSWMSATMNTERWYRLQESEVSFV